LGHLLRDRSGLLIDDILDVLVTQLAKFVAALKSFDELDFTRALEKFRERACMHRKISGNAERFAFVAPR